MDEYTQNVLADTITNNVVGTIWSTPGNLIYFLIYFKEQIAVLSSHSTWLCD